MATSRDSNPWITFPKPNPQARLRLFCFPYAGGGAALFRTWPEDLPAHIEVCAIQPPGRESRFGEARFTRLPPLVEALDVAINPFLQTMPFAFFGHSLGAITSFELARTLRRRHGPMPTHLLVSAHRAPQLPEHHQSIHHLADDLFLQELRTLNGIPAGVAENTDLMELMMPLLRADFGIAETYAYTEDTPLPCPISAYGGLADEGVSQEEMAAWRSQTQADFKLHMLAGDHFFFFTKNRSALLQSIIQELTGTLS